MSKYVIGIDPDSKKHGVATYKDGKLIRLDMMDLMELMTYLQNINSGLLFGEWIDIHIEDNVSNKRVFADRLRKAKTMAVAARMGSDIGKLKQCQVELERMITHLFGADNLFKHFQSNQWKKNKAQFEKVTGWTGRSNEDTRSAAYFGYLGL